MVEVNFDGLVGPTHHFGGLSEGNVASMGSKGQVSYPKKAALEGLKKMSLVHSLGFPQGVLPPQLRPDLKTLEALGYTLETAPLQVVLQVSSASSMWAANSGVFTPSSDTPDGKVHFTPANLKTTIHRSLETEHTANLFKKLFPNFVHHEPVPYYSDEGAANHVRLAGGIHLFVYSPKIGRQSQEASKSIARSHGIYDRSLFLEQSEEAVRKGVFHNDVISFGHEKLFIYHEKAFTDMKPVRKLPVDLFEITEKELSLEDAVSTYFFNSQLLNNVLIASKQCETHPGVQKILSRLPLKAVHYVDLSQSMANGGGPACLKISVPLTEKEIKTVHPAILWNEALERKLTEWVEYYYPEELRWDDLKDPALLERNQEAIKSLSSILNLSH